MTAATDRDCVTCGKRFRGIYRKCRDCRAIDRSCANCGRAFHSVDRICAQCRSTERTCVTCGTAFTGRNRECNSCLRPIGPCQIPGCGSPKVPGHGSKLCQEHRDGAYQRKLERIRKTDCYMPGCPEPKLTGKFRYCARHSAEGPQRERAQIVRRKRERDYGLTHDEYVALLEAQGGVCAICGNGEQRRALAVDHDHETGAVRGLLCDRCNPMLGYARDNVAVLQTAIEYLTKCSGIQTAPLCIPLHFRGGVPS